MVELQGFSSAGLADGRRSIATRPTLSNGRSARLPDLEQRTGERRAADVDAGCRLAVHLDARPAGSAAAPRSSMRRRARRRAAPAGGPDRRRAARTSGTSAGASWRRTTRVKCSSPARAPVRPVPARGDPARQLELPLHRILGVLAADEQLPPLRAAPCPGSTSSCRTSPRAAR